MSENNSVSQSGDGSYLSQMPGVEKKDINNWDLGGNLSPEDKLARDEAMRYRLGGLTLGELPPEIKNRAADERYQPWKVTLWIQDHQFAIDLRPVSYFTRGPSPEHSINLAYKLWERWEKVERGIDKNAEYPDVSDGAHNTGLCIDESDWKEYLKEARRFGGKKDLQIVYAGNVLHPFFWTCPGMIFDVEGHEAFDPNPHKSYEKKDDSMQIINLSDDSATPDW